jgi:hypothetical protein
MNHTSAIEHSGQLGSQPALYVDVRANSTRKSHVFTSGHRTRRRITMARAFNPITRPDGVRALISVSVPFRLTGLSASDVAPPGLRRRGDGPAAGRSHEILFMIFARVYSLVALCWLRVDVTRRLTAAA